MPHAVTKFRFQKTQHNVVLYYNKKVSYNIPLYVMVIHTHDYSNIAQVILLLRFTRHWQLSLNIFHVPNYKPTKKRKEKKNYKTSFWLLLISYTYLPITNH